MIKWRKPKTFGGPYDWEKLGIKNFPDRQSSQRWKDKLTFATLDFQELAKPHLYRRKNLDLLFHVLPALKLDGPWTPAHDGGCPHQTWNNQFGSVHFTCAYWIGFAPNERKLKTLWPYGSGGCYVVRSCTSSGQLEYTSFIAEANTHDWPEEKILQEQEAHMTLFSQWIDEYRRFGDQPQWLMGIQREDDDPAFTPWDRERHSEYKIRLNQMIERVLEERVASKRWKQSNNIYLRDY